ncbi:hypothetical protein A5724_25290 [Mycobacterium sp. ACS1612]|uniref:DUF1214 domain-containing protein n=1 Tax=Mycobacterium sp. ACS1612 TaxID=1834117 RepID=UPI0008015B8F|nr:DUF1214 domain-containing protein [Mycobacterium sp. ACS1612]OBF29283.1 hypothetical protein A5724_25290 [Mycobacterium sp. ACS1612]
MATKPFTYGRFIGRVGGLAVALGIGAAIANDAAIASADEGQSGTSEGSASASASESSDHRAEHKPATKTVKKDLKDSTDRNDGKPAAPPKKKKKTPKTQLQAVSTNATGDEPAPKPDTPAQTVAVASTVGTASGEVTKPVTKAAVHEPATQTLAVSPLGTPEQRAAERRAAETVNTLPVQLMKLVLQFGWRSTAQQQFKLVGGPDQANLDALNQAVDEYAMGAAFQQQLLNPMTPTAVAQVAPPHTWYGQDVGGSRILYDNPDTIYRFMAVNKTSTYVITGRFTGEDPAETTFSVLTGLSGSTASVLNGKDLQRNPDGSFTITVSGSPTGPGPNHIQITDDTTLIAVRNTLSDWNTQDPMTLSIERTGGPPNSLFAQLGGFAIPFIGPTVTKSPLLTTLVSLVPPLPVMPPLLRGTVTAVIMALGLQMEATYIKVATVDPTTGERRQPNVFTDPTQNAQFLSTQMQSAGYFQLDDSQALVLTIDPGDAGYFVVPVTNDWTITDNYWDQQTSLNISQARKNDDGTYTIVVSPQDPQIWNWVSTGGLHQGTISIRFQDLPEKPTNLPTVSSQVVSLDQLPGVLPAGTVPADAAVRQGQLAERKSGFDRRFAPYPQP